MKGEKMNRKEAIEVIQKNWPYGRYRLSEALQTLIPEFNESEDEDEKIRKALINVLKNVKDINQELLYFGDYKYENYIALLEKQGEQKEHLELKAGHWYFCHQAYCERADILTVKEGERFKCEEDGIIKGLIIKEPEKYFREISTPSDKLEPMFKVGDWIVYCNEDVDLITGIETNGYLINKSGYIPFICQGNMRLWTIQDAKDGDVLANKDGAIFINAGSDESRVTLDSYCYISVQGEFCIEEHKTGSWFYKDMVIPATKEQRDLLFQKMREAGYEWDAEKKELRKIEQKSLQWNISDYRTWQYIVSDVLTKYNGIGQYLDNGTCKNIAKYMQENWSKRLSLGRNSAAWSEEDESRRIFICKVLHDAKSIIKYEDDHKIEIDECLTWLKSLKERIKGE